MPDRSFDFAEWKFAKVNIDHHVELEGHYYSVPHALVGEKVELCFSAGTLEVYFRGDLENGLDRVEDPNTKKRSPQPRLPPHENLRRRDYYTHPQPREGESNNAQ